MSTTALLVELLVIGFEVWIWLLLLIATIMDNPGQLINFGHQIQSAGLLIVVFLLSVAYIFGIIVDKTMKYFIENSSLARFFQVRSFDSQVEDSDLYRVAMLQQYAYVVVRDGDVMSDLLYGRSKVRILRASIPLFPLISLTVVLLLARHTPLGQSGWPLGLLLGIGLIVSLLVLYITTWLFRYNSWLYQYRLKFFYDAGSRMDENSSPSS